MKKLSLGLGLCLILGHVVLAEGGDNDPQVSTQSETSRDAPENLAPPPELGDLLRNSDGSARKMTYREALRACPPGSHLPTAWEFAQLARPLGIKVSKTRPEPWLFYHAWNHSTTRATNPDGTKDVFYTGGWENYQRPEGELGLVKCWTSSTAPASHFSFYYSSRHGGVAPEYNNDDTLFAVRCAKDQ